MTTDLAQHLKRLEQSLLDPRIRSDREQLAALLDPNFVEIASTGEIATRVQIVESLRTEPPVTRQLSNFHVRLLTIDIALATYRLSRTAETGATVHSLRSSIWKRHPQQDANDNPWRMIFHQGTPLPEDSRRDRLTP